MVQYTKQISNVGFHGVISLLKSLIKYYVYCFEGKFLLTCMGVLLSGSVWTCMGVWQMMCPWSPFPSLTRAIIHFDNTMDVYLPYFECVKFVIGISVDVTLKYRYKHWVYRIWTVLLIILAPWENYWLVMSDVSLGMEAKARVRGQTSSSDVVWFHHFCLSFPSYESTIFEF